MKKIMNMLVLVVLVGFITSCVPIDPNWTPEQQAKVQSSNAQMAQGVGMTLLGTGATLFGASQLNNSMHHGGYYYGGRHYYNRGYRHGHYYYY